MSEWNKKTELRDEGPVDIYTPKNPLPDHPVWITCDFCDKQTKSATLYNSKAVDLPREPGLYRSIHFDEGWAACPHCEALVDARDYKALTARKMTLCGETDARLRRILENLHEAVMLSLTDEKPMIWVSGERLPWPRKEKG